MWEHQARRWEEAGVTLKMLRYGMYNGLQQHKYLPVTSDMLLTSPHNLRSEELSMAQLM